MMMPSYSDCISGSVISVVVGKVLRDEPVPISQYPPIIPLTLEMPRRR